VPSCFSIERPRIDTTHCVICIMMRAQLVLLMDMRLHALCAVKGAAALESELQSEQTE
jgi:hypothetical protein